MSSPYAIAREHLDAAFEAAGAADVDGDRLCKAVLSELLRRWAAASSVEDVRSAAAFELQHLAGDEDIEFMRP